MLMSACLFALQNYHWLIFSFGFEDSLEPLEVVPTGYDWKSHWLVLVRISVSCEDFSQWEFNLCENFSQW